MSLQLFNKPKKLLLLLFLIIGVVLFFCALYHLLTGPATKTTSTLPPPEKELLDREKIEPYTHDYDIVPADELDVLPTENECVISGCNSEICSERSYDSGCVYLPEFQCYTAATCEVQPDEKCGWTPTPELTSCINEHTENT